MVATRRSTRTTTAQPRQPATAAQAGDDSDLSECESSAASAASDDEEDAAPAHSYDSFESDEDASELDDDHDDDFKLESDKPKTSKKKKSAPSSRKKQKASRAQTSPSFNFTRLPNELLVEVFSHLEPTDLLSLRKTSRDFHAFLSSKASIFVWSAARQETELPKPPSHLTEIEYARLIFEKHCQGCGAAHSQTADLALGLRLCKQCRKDNWLKLDRDLLEDNYTHIHPLAFYSVKFTLHSAAEARYHAANPYCYLPHLEAVSRELWTLSKQSKSRQALKARSEKTVPGEADVVEGDGATSDSDDDDNSFFPGALFWEAGRYDQATARFAISRDTLKSYPESMKVFVERARRVNDTAALWVLKNYQSLPRALNALEAEKYRRVEMREREMSKRLSAEFGFAGDKFRLSSVWIRNKLVESPTLLTDAEWLMIKDKILATAMRAREDMNLRDRQESLRPRWKKLFTSATVRNRSAVNPSFQAYLNLPAIKGLWESKPDLFKWWEASPENVEEDLEEWRSDVRIEAIKTILAATTEKTRQELDEMDADDYAEFDDAFFERPTSYLVCTLDGCQESGSPDRPSHYENAVYYGPLDSLLKHQAEKHTLATPPKKKMPNRLHLTQQYDFALPATIVSALSAIIELADLDDATATVDDLDRFMPPTHQEPGESWREWEKRKPDLYLEYENSPGARDFDNWRGMMNFVVRLDRRQPKSRPLPVPTMALNLRGAAAAAAHAKERQKAHRQSAMFASDEEDDD